MLLYKRYLSGQEKLLNAGAMKQDSNLVKTHSHDSMAQVAWLYHVGNLSQQEISDKLGISRFKIVRPVSYTHLTLPTT